MAQICDILIILATSLCLIRSEDVFYTINSKKVLHKTSDKFLSISIDPAVLLAGVNLSDVSLNLAKHLSPAYIRLAGPSTSFVKYIDNEEDLTEYKENNDNVYITPSMWFGLNEWFGLANLTPVFGINDGETDKGVWNPKSTLPLFEMSDKFGVSCYWQLGFGCSNKTTVQYVESLNILRQTLSGFPAHNDTWRIVGSDLSSCNSNDITSDNFGDYIRDLDKNVDAIMWQSAFISKQELGLVRAALWGSIPKDIHPVAFSSALQWALKVGEAATLEYDVVFREPRLLEFTHDTPVYWFSLIYKKLMGSTVLEIKSMSPNTNVSTFAHCTKRKSSLVRGGAVTVMVVNNGSKAASINLRLGSFLMDKFMEIQSYFLVESPDEISQTLLNDVPLTIDVLQKPDHLLRPKLRRAKVWPHISLEVPSTSIAFFVLIGAKFSVCNNNEEDLSLILEELKEDQGEEASFKIEQRLQNVGSTNTNGPRGDKITLQNIKKGMLKELEQDQSYYEKSIKRPKANVYKNFSKKSNVEDNGEDKREQLHNHLKAFIEKSRKSSLQPTTNNGQPPTRNLQLTLKEIEGLLKNRARAKAAEKNIKLTSTELDLLVDKATVRIPKHFVSKRDINRILLEEKANYYKNNHFTQEMFEELAKSQKNYSKFKKANLRKRSINMQLLNLKAMIEKNKNYLMERNGQLRQSLSRKPRDINLDLLKRRTEPRNGIVVQPNYKNHRSSFFSRRNDKYAPINLDGDELFDDSLEDETAFRDLKDLEKITKSKYLKPDIDVYSSRSPEMKSKLAKLDSDEYLQFLKSSGESYGALGRDDEEPCLDEFGYSVSDSNFDGKSKKITKVWGLKSDRKGKEQSLCADLNDFNLGDYMDYGFFRKKRDTKVTRQKLKALKKHIKNEVRKMKHQLKDDKLKYYKEKLKRRKFTKEASNVQIIAAKSNDTRINNLIAHADSTENTIPPPIKEHRKRSVLNNDMNNIFGPLAPIFQSFKPTDYLAMLPVYGWLQNQNLRTFILERQYLNRLGLLRKRRYIEDNSLNAEQNEIGGSASKENSKLVWTHGKEDEYSSPSSNLELQTTTEAARATVKPEATRVAAKFTSGGAQDYLERILGRKKAETIKGFFVDVKDKFNDMNRNIKNFFKDLF